MSVAHTDERPGVLAGPDEVADCTAVVVTYNSAADIGGLLDSLPAAAPGRRIRVVVVDNDSRDGIEDVLVDRPAVVFVRSGGNLGYAGGINVARQHLGRTRAVLVLNPDLRLDPGSVSRLLTVLHEGAGAVVPRIVGDDGDQRHCLRREPSLTRALGDALLGRRWPDRPDWLSEMVWAPEPYERQAPVEWATGAAILVSAAADAAIGEWDTGRFFLYSEETDYCRRLRSAGYGIRYVPDAVVRHRGGGSGTSADLVALNEVNRVRYYRKYHGPVATAAFRGVVALAAALRAHRAGNRRALRAVLSRRSAAALPGGDR
jgi:N-acetylglucosaminyl-diphospho-decaprenol L-rhamnosyltransferase